MNRGVVEILCSLKISSRIFRLFAYMIFLHNLQFKAKPVLIKLQVKSSEFLQDDVAITQSSAQHTAREWMVIPLSCI